MSAGHDDRMMNIREDGEREPPAGPGRRADLVARVGPRACAIDLLDRWTLHLDAEGRWTSLRDGERRHRRTVDARVLRPEGGGFATCGQAESDLAHRLALDIGRRVEEALRTLPPRRVHLIGDRDALRERLARAATWTPARFARERRRFARAYRAPVSILPPHRYRDLVLQPALGCPSNACTFCELYGDRRFEVLDEASFATHAREVHALLGAAAAERDGIFFDSGSALTLPVEAILARVAIAREVFGEPARGFAAFYDPDRGALRPTERWASLAAAGLRDATVGLETGLEALREAVHKAGDLGRFTEVVRRMKEGGMRVAVTVLVGLGGPGAADAHLRATCERIGALGLGPEDLVYLSRLAGSMDGPALRAQTAAFRRGLRERTEARVGAYRIERFDHFA